MIKQKLVLIILFFSLLLVFMGEISPAQAISRGLTLDQIKKLDETEGVLEINFNSNSESILRPEPINPTYMRVGLITDIAGIADMGWNWLSYQGLLRAQTDFGVQIALYEPTSDPKDDYWPPTVLTKTFTVDVMEAR